MLIDDINFESAFNMIEFLGEKAEEAKKSISHLFPDFSPSSEKIETLRHIKAQRIKMAFFLGEERKDMYGEEAGGPILAQINHALAQQQPIVVASKSILESLLIPFTFSNPILNQQLRKTQNYNRQFLEQNYSLFLHKKGGYVVLVSHKERDRFLNGVQNLRDNFGKVSFRQLPQHPTGKIRAKDLADCCKYRSPTALSLYITGHGMYENAPSFDLDVLQKNQALLSAAVYSTYIEGVRLIQPSKNEKPKSMITGLPSQEMSLFLQTVDQLPNGQDNIVLLQSCYLGGKNLTYVPPAEKTIYIVRTIGEAPTSLEHDQADFTTYFKQSEKLTRAVHPILRQALAKDAIKALRDEKIENQAQIRYPGESRFVPIEGTPRDVLTLPSENPMAKPRAIFLREKEIEQTVILEIEPKNSCPIIPDHHLDKVILRDVRAPNLDLKQFYEQMILSGTKELKILKTLRLHINSLTLKGETFKDVEIVLYPNIEDEFLLENLWTRMGSSFDYTDENGEHKRYSFG